MPVYEFQCKQCHQIFEVQQRLADAPKTVCDACGGPLEKLISRSAFQFKGGGWYKDLYASPKPGAAASPGTSTSSATPESSGGSAATPSTPAAAPSGTPSGGGSTGGNGAQARQR